MAVRFTSSRRKGGEKEPKEVVLGLDETVDLAGVESFPASDPPAWTASRIGPPSSDDGGADVSFHDLNQHVRDDVHLFSETLGERNDASRETRVNLAVVADLVEARLKSLGLPVKRRPSTDDPSNVEAVIRGATTPNESIVVGAHYDTARGSPGADDNASGIATLLALARLLVPSKLDRTVRLAAFTNEEPPHTWKASMGSVRYADSLAREGIRVVAMLSLEMLGIHGPRPRFRVPAFMRRDALVFVGDLRARRLAKRAKKAFDGADSGIPTGAINLPLIFPGVRASDHWSFAKRHIPAAMLTDMGPLRSGAYHRPSDRPERLDYDRLARASHAIACVVRELATTHERGG